ncbi:hypothetical protein [Thalassobaculum litoreum]|uniref:hypothetical protein n=1 Tax=Thalassobaculum litoreum TaxID=420996 RepID=UPI0011138659|nr:hypothetical protein [Thalassobaculum litoreum]
MIAFAVDAAAAGLYQTVHVAMIPASFLLYLGGRDLKTRAVERRGEKRWSLPVRRRYRFSAH